MDIDVRAINEKIERESAFLDILTLEMNKVIVGQKQMIESLLIGLLGNGHILLEGVPGLAKTLAINTLSKAVQASFCPTITLFISKVRISKKALSLSIFSLIALTSISIVLFLFL